MIKFYLREGLPLALQGIASDRLLPAVHCLGGFAVELDGACFAGGGSEVACGVAEASEFGAVPVVVV